MRCGLLLKLSLCGALVALAISSIHLWLKKKDYLFSEDVISKLGRDALKKHGTATTAISLQQLVWSPDFFRCTTVTVGDLVPLTYARHIVHMQAATKLALLLCI